MNFFMILTRLKGEIRMANFKKKPKKPQAADSTNTTTSTKKSSKGDPGVEYLELLKKNDALGDIKRKINFIPTGSWSLNRAIGDGTHQESPGGYPRGYMTEIYGGESCGKTTLALHAVREVQKLGGSVIYADFEHSLRTQFKYIENLGINLSPPAFYHMTPKSFEEGTNLIGTGLITLKPALIVVDSVTAMLPKETSEAEADAGTAIGKHARLMSTFLNWMNKRLEKYDTSLILLNQLRTVIKASKYDPGPNETTSGGKAPKYFATLRVELKSKQQEKVTVISNITGASEEKCVNQVVEAIVTKSKLDLPFKRVPLFITFGQGINNILSLVELGINRNIIKKGGAGYYEWKDPNDKYSFKIQGRQSVLTHLEKNTEVLEALKPYLVPKQSIQDMIELRDELLLKGEEITEDEQENLNELNKILGEKKTEIVELSDEDRAELAELQGMMGSGIETEKIVE
jgi:recombination protein RecA